MCVCLLHHCRKVDSVAFLSTREQPCGTSFLKTSFWHWWLWLAQLCLQAWQTSEETLTCECSRRITQGSAVTNQSTAVQIPRAKYPNPQILGNGVYSLPLFFNLCLGPRHQSTKNLVWDTDLKSLRAPTKGSIFDTVVLTVAVSWTCTHLYT